MPRDIDTILRDLFKGGFIIFVGLVAELFFSFWAKLLMARTLGKVNYGSVSIGFTILNITVIISLMGIHTGVARYLPRKDSPEYRSRVIRSGAWIVFPISLVSTVLIYLLAPFIATAIFKDPSVMPVIRIFAFAIPVFASVRFGIGVFQGLQRSTPKVIIQNLLLPVIRFALVISALLLGLGALGVSYAYVLTYALGAVITLVYLYKRTPFRLAPPSESMGRALLVFSTPLLIMSATNLVMGNIDTFLIGYFLTTGTVGEYHVIYPLGKLLMTVIGAFSFLFMPVLSELHSQTNNEEMHRVFEVLTKWVFLATFPLFLVLTIYPGLLISMIFGQEYESAAVALRILSIGFFANAVLGLTVKSLESIGKTQLIMISNVIAALTNVVLNILLIPRFGLNGAAIATTASFILMQLLYSYVLFEETGIHPVSTELINPGVATTGIILSLYIGFQVITVTRLVEAGAIFVMFGFLYPVIIIRFGGIGDAELMILASIEERFGMDLGPLRTIAEVFSGK